MTQKLLQAALALLLLGCDPVPDARALRMVTLQSTQEVELSLRELPPQALRSIGLPYGLAVVKAGGLAERAGLKIGDVVFGVNQKRIGNLEEFHRLVAERAGGRLGFLVRRGGSDLYVVVSPPARETLLRT